MTKRNGRSCGTAGSTGVGQAADAPRQRPGCVSLGCGVNDQLVSSVPRLRVRYDRRDDIHQGLCNLAEILITFRFLDLYGVT